MNKYIEKDNGKNNDNNHTTTKTKSNKKIDEIRRNSKEYKQNRPRIFSRDASDLTRTMLSSSPR